MTTALMYAAIFVGCAVLAATLLGVRDSYWKRVQKQRQAPQPAEERIAEIRAAAAEAAKEFQEHVDRRTTEQTDAQGKAKLLAVVGYYKRLEVLASNPGVSIIEVEQFAKECNGFLRDHRLKGFMVGCEANELVELLRKRKAA